MSILGSLFGGSAPAAAPTNTPANAPAEGGAAPAAPSNAPAPASGEAPTGTAALMELFSAKPAGEEGSAPELNLTHDILANATKNMNFMRGVSEEQMQAVQSGDTNALMSIIQTVGRNAYENAMLDSTGLAGKFAGQRSDYAAQQAAKGIRSHVIESQVEVENLSPAAQTVFRQLASKVAERNPSATANEVKAQATALLQQMAQEFSFKGKEQSAPVEDDWSKVFA